MSSLSRCALLCCSVLIAGVGCKGSGDGGPGPVIGSGGSSGASGATGAGGGAIATGGAAGPVDAGGAGGQPGTGSGGAGSGGMAGSAAGGSSGTGGLTGAGGATLGLPARADILGLLTRANDYFMAKWPDPGIPIVTDATRASNIWTRGVYYEGLLALYAVDAQTRYRDYAVLWGTRHAWGLNNGAATRSADDQCAGQTYIDLYRMDPLPERIRDIKASIDAMVAGAAVTDWTWIDAIQMSMPVFARLGVVYGNANYFAKMYAFYRSAKAQQGTAGFYSTTDHLWWRDVDFDPPYVEPNGRSCYWSRGNGWVYAALARVLDILPATDAHRAEYLADFLAMSDALRAVQRSDGFWNVSLHDPTHFGGPELTGTSLFAYGMAWGIRQGLLSPATFGPVVRQAWIAMATAVHTNGFLGYVQGTGKQPSDSQPVTFDSVPNFEDFGLGCFLLGGSEVWKLAR